ncbi:MAG: MFS transporter [Planctomycetota bacterium]|jgi:UMF1 family MFS transporter
MARPLRAPLSWVVYDLANTIYSAIVVTVLINIYVESILEAATYASAANFISMIAAGLVAPAFGEVTDRAGTSKRWLVVTTVVTCLACVLMGVAVFLAPPRVAVWVVLLAFAVANFCYQLSLVFYNSLLPGLVPSGRVGFWSGLGVGVGYFGMALGMVVVVALSDTALGFAAAGALFLVLSLPLFAWVKERPASVIGAAVPRVAEALKQSLGIWRDTLRQPVARRFLLGNFCLTDVLNTTILMFSLYCKKVFDGIEGSEDVAPALIVLSLTAFPLGVAAGWLSDRFGPKTGLILSAVSLAVALGAGVVMPAARFGTTVVFLGTFGAFGLAGIWTAGRALLVRIAPKEKIGEYFGMYGLTLKVSVFGSLLFTLLADLLPFEEAMRYRFGLASGFLPLAIGVWLIGGLKAGAAEA